MGLSEREIIRQVNLLFFYFLLGLLLGLLLVRELIPRGKMRQNENEEEI